MAEQNTSVRRHKGAIKRIKQSAKRHARNHYFISSIKTEEKKFLKAIDEKKTKEEIAKLYKGLVSLYDSVADKGIIHRNKAARKVSELTKIFNSSQKEPVK